MISWIVQNGMLARPDSFDASSQANRYTNEVPNGASEETGGGFLAFMPPAPAVAVAAETTAGISLSTIAATIAAPVLALWPSSLADSTVDNDVQGRRRNVMVRLQAQGGALEASSPSVLINSGPAGVVTGADGLAGLAQLQELIGPAQTALRASGFARAERFITSAGAYGGAVPPGLPSRSFNGLRVDVEVIFGTAFTAGPRSDAAILIGGN